MTAPHAAPETAYVLQTWPWKETSLLVELFTQGQGKILAVARGAKRPASHFKGLVTPLVKLSVRYAGTGEIRNLTHAELAAAPLALEGDALFLAFYVNELIVRLLAREDPYGALFDDYEEVLADLAAGARPEVALVRFEGRLLRHLGYALPEDTMTWVWDALGMHAFDAEAAYGQDAVFITPEMNRAIGSEAYDEAEVLAFAKRLFRQMLAFYVGDRPLSSRRILQKLKTLENPS